MISQILAAIVSMSSTAAAPEPELTGLGEFIFEYDPAAEPNSSALVASVAPALNQDLSAAPPPRFGQAQSAYWTINLGVGSNLDEDHFGKGGVGISYFLADDFSLDFELNFMHFWQQTGRDVSGVNLNLLFRWHFLHDESRSWTVYADGGAGMLATTDDVPITGSSFNFTPQAGAGVSFDLGNDVRLYTGARWHHVSNARLFASNPGRDYGVVYAMLSWPF